jgi:4-methyl-5(b-hydroxyethyl)-thiazole monophosphate biosynthesis
MVYIILGNGFEEAEALCAADVLRRGGVDTALTGTERRSVTGSHDIAVTADVVCADVKLQSGDMVVLPGGMGGVESIEHSEAAMALVRKAAQDKDLWLAAICAAPTLLARAGLIGSGDHAVCYPGMEGEMTDRGVTAHMDQSTVVCGKLITGRAPGSAFDFGLQLLEALKGPEAAQTVRNGLHY